MNELLNNPDISIVVPVYNVNKWLPRCINSLLKQKFSGLYELLLIDDGSTDSSGETCDAFQSLYNNVRTFHKKNGGLSDARNYGSLKARAEYITFVDSDDEMMPETLKAYSEAVDKYGEVDNRIIDFLHRNMELYIQGGNKEILTNDFEEIGSIRFNSCLHEG